MQKILVLRGGALGDFIVTLPALRLLRQRWPRARIELAGNPSAAALGRAEGLIDTVHAQHEARWGGLYAGSPLPAPFADWLGTFDLVVSYWPDPEGELARHFPARPGQVFLSTGTRPEQAPAAAHFCAPLQSLGLQARDDFFYRLAAPLGGATAGPASRRVALHPGSGSPRKNWPLARWIELCRALACRPGTDLLIVSGEAESPAMLAGFGESAHNLPLSMLLARLSACRLFLGHDSGVSHLAAALGIPCVLLFGPSDPAMWAPPAPHVRVLRRGPDLGAISVADVLAEVDFPVNMPGPR